MREVAGAALVPRWCGPGASARRDDCGARYHADNRGKEGVAFVEIGILGPLHVAVSGTPIAVHGSKRRLLLSALALHAGRTVSVERLVDVLWSDAQTDASASTLQSYVYQLRKLIGADVVATEPQGYALGWRTGSVDACRFEQLVVEASAATPDLVTRRLRLSEALALWRGPALAEFPDVAALTGAVVRLEELRLRALEDRIDADLALGDHGPLVAELEHLVTEQPLRERLWGQLILALYRGGRQAESLRAFGRLRSTLREQLGLDPSPALVRLEGQILAHDEALELPTAPRSTPVRAAVTVASPTIPGMGVGSQSIAFLFTDIQGSTERWESDPPGMDAALAEHDRIVRAEIASTGGEVLSTAGDSFLACFKGATGTADAIAAALAIQVALGEVDWSPIGGIAVRMGVHTGPVFERDGMYFGPTLNRAARLHAIGHGGQVLVSAAAVLAAGDRLPVGVGLVDLGSHRLRDLGQPERIHQLTHPRLGSTFPPLKAEVAGDLTEVVPMVGRSNEMDRLGQRIRGIRGGSAGGVAMLVGEPGIGKTRIAAAAADMARRDGVRVLWGRSFGGAWAPPYGPFADAISDLLRQEDRLTVEALGSRGRVVARLVPELASEVLPADELNASEQRTQMFVAVAGLLGELADVSALMVVLDDLHWADRATAALFRYVARELAGRPVLLLGTYRDSEVTKRHPLRDVLGALPRETDYERFQLAGLGEDDVTLLAQVIIGEELPPEVLKAVAADTGGNAFFVHQVLQQLEAQRIAGDDLLDMFAVPATVLDVVDHRVFQLPDVAQRLLRAASVFDGDFEFPAVSGVAELAEDDALDGLDSALDSRLLGAADQPDSYRFTHALVRQALLTGLSPSRVVRLHRRAALALEAEAAGPTLDPTRAAEIAMHYLRSMSLPGAERGVEPALAAADHAEKIGAYDEAVARLRMAHQLLPDGDGRHPTLLGRLGCALARAGQDEEAVARMDEALDIIASAHGDDRAAAYAVEANEALLTGLSWASKDLIEKGLRYAGDRRDLTWAALFVLSVDLLEGLPEQREALLTDEFRQASEMVVAGGRHRIGIALPAACRDRDDVLRVPSWPSAHMFLAGELRSPLAELNLDAELAWKEGRLHWWAHTRAYAAVCLTALGDLGHARAILDSTAGVRLPPTPSLDVEIRMLVAAYLLASAWDATWDYMDAFASKLRDELAVAQRVHRGDHVSVDTSQPVGMFAVGAAKILARSGNPSAAMRQLDAAVPLLDIASLRVGLNDILLVHDFVEVLWYCDATDHLDLAEHAVRALLARDFRYPMTEARLSMARLAALRGDVQAATAWFDKAREVLDESGARTMRAIVDFDEAVMHVRLDAVGDQTLMGVRLGQARSQFEDIGMPGWLRRADALG
jgi:DNA-binding SARP family transcriptional activator/tetratricopeptide (TPR) repeat protein